MFWATKPRSDHLIRQDKSGPSCEGPLCVPGQRNLVRICCEINLGVDFLTQKIGIGLWIIADGIQWLHQTVPLLDQLPIGRDQRLRIFDAAFLARDAGDFTQIGSAKINEILKKLGRWFVDRNSPRSAPEPQEGSWRIVHVVQPKVRPRISD